MGYGDIDSIYHGTINATKVEIANTPQRISNVVLLNLEAAPGYVQIFYLPAASVTVGTTVADFVIPLPTSGGVALPFPGGGWKTRGSALTIAATTTATGSTNSSTYVAFYKMR